MRHNAFHVLIAILLATSLVAALPGCGAGGGTSVGGGGGAVAPDEFVPPEPPPPLPEPTLPVPETLDTSFLQLGVPGTQVATGTVRLKDAVVELQATDILEEMATGGFVVDPSVSVAVDDFVVRWDTNRIGRVSGAQKVVDEAGQAIGTAVSVSHATLEDVIEDGRMTWNVTPKYTAAPSSPTGLQKASEQEFFRRIDGGFRVQDVELFDIRVTPSGTVDWSASHFAGKGLSRFFSPLLDGASLEGAAGGGVTATIDELQITLHPTLRGSSDLPRAFETRIDAIVKVKAIVTIEATGEVHFGISKSLPSPAPIPLPVPIPVSLDVDFLAGMNIDVEAAGSVTVGIDHEYALKHHARYQDGRMVVWESDSAFVDREPILQYVRQLDATARLSLDVRTTLRFFEMVGPYFVIQPYVEGNIQMPWRSNHPDFKVGIAGQAGLNLGASFFNRDIFQPKQLFDVAVIAVDVFGPGDGNRQNQAPIAQHETVHIPKNRAYTLTLPGSDPDGDALTWRITSDPQHGWLGVLSGDRIEYTPRGEPAQELLQIEVIDTNGARTTGSVWIQILDKSAPFADFDYRFTANRLDVTPASTDVEDHPSNLSYRWDFDGDGRFDTAWQDDRSMTKTYGSFASRSVILEVKDSDDMVSRVSHRLAPGDDSAGQFVALATGYFHGVALDKDGRVWTWGLNGTTGALGDLTPMLRTTPKRLSGLPTIKQIAAGYQHTLMLDSLGRVWAFGENGRGQLGDGTRKDRSTPRIVQGLPKIKKIAAGEEFSLALDTVGDLWVWGMNGEGQLAKKDEYYLTRPGVSGLIGRLTDISAGYEHALGRDENGVVWAWGDNYDLALGNGGGRFDRPVAVSGVTGASMTAAGDGHSLAVVNGRLYGWGKNKMGQTGYGDDQPSEIGTATRMSISGVKHISTGDESSFAILSDGLLLAWGENRLGELGIGFASWEEHDPVYPHAPRGFEAVSGGRYFTLALRNGHIWSWGTNKFGSLGTGDHADHFAPQRVVIER